MKNAFILKNDFINIFSGKPKTRFLKYLGEPANKEIAIKPKDASKVIARPTDNKTKVKTKWKCGTTQMLLNIHRVKLIKEQKLPLSMTDAEV